MTDALLFVSVGSILSVGVATLIIATLTMQNGRRYVELAEAHMKYLREEQARLVMFLRDERQSLKEELEREREQRLEAQRRAEWASRDRVPLQQTAMVEGLDQEQHEGWEGELRTRRDVEHRIDELKREFQRLREIQQDREADRETPPPASRGTFGDSLEEKTLPAHKEKASDTPPEDGKPRLAVWHPHPDDDVNPGSTSARSLSDSPIEMFRRHYDKYLENYEGYVKLVERIYRMRDEVPPGSLAEREWEGRLRRVIDGIERTTARLDLLEEYNPELATDDRISRRAVIARRYSELEGRRR